MKKSWFFVHSLVRLWLFCSPIAWWLSISVSYRLNCNLFASLCVHRTCALWEWELTDSASHHIDNLFIAYDTGEKSIKTGRALLSLALLFRFFALFRIPMCLSGKSDASTQHIMMTKAQNHHGSDIDNDGGEIQFWHNHRPTKAHRNWLRAMKGNRNDSQRQKTKWKKKQCAHTHTFNGALIVCAPHRWRRWQLQNKNYIFLPVWSQSLSNPMGKVCERERTTIALFSFIAIWVGRQHIEPLAAQIMYVYKRATRLNCFSSHLCTSKMCRYHSHVIISHPILALILFLHLFCFIIIAILSSNLWKLCYWNENEWSTFRFWLQCAMPCRAPSFPFDCCNVTKYIRH